MKIKEFLRAIADFAVPRTCLVCGRSLADKEGAEICLECCLNLPRTGMHTVATQSRGLNAVQERLADGPPLLYGAAWFYYSRNSPYATLIRTAKYYSRPDCGRSLGSMYARELMADAPEIARHIDVLLPVGMHWLKQLRRGYNQSREIAEGMGSVLGIAVGDNLTAVRGHATQTRRTADERRKNLKGIFAISHPEEIRGLNVAVVDDVITSGTTAAEAARAVLDAGAATASIFALGLTNS